MSGTKSALVLLILILGGTLSLAAPDTSDDQSAECTRARSAQSAPNCCAARESCDGSLAIIESRLNDLFPGCQIRLLPVQNRLVVTGEVQDDSDAAQIVAVVRALAVRQCVETPAISPPAAPDEATTKEHGSPEFVAVLNLIRVGYVEPTGSAEVESDAEQPHPTAILLTPSDGEPLGRSPTGPGPRVAEIRACPGRCVELKQPPATRDPLALHFEHDPSINVVRPCGDCHAKPECNREPSHCCKQIAAASAEECIEDEEIEVEMQWDAEQCETIECFVEQVLHAHAQHLQGMMQARLHHERTLLAVRAEAESRIGQLKDEHAAALTRLRADHMAEVKELQQAMWQTERRMVEAQHRQALEHERQLAELHRRQFEQFQSHRVATLESEIQSLKRRIEAMAAPAVAADGSAAVDASSRRARHTEIPIHVQDLASGRVRYSPAGGHDAELLDVPPLATVERVELSTPPRATPVPAYDVERLRREVARLRALVEDLLCIAPELTPLPKPQTTPESHDD